MFRQAMRYGKYRAGVPWGMKTILAPVDFSPVSDQIVRSATDLARAFGAKVVLLHVVQPPIVTSEYALPVEAVQETIDASEQVAKTRLAAIAATLQSAGVTTETVVRQGPPVLTILTEAEAVQADCIIMGSHGHGRIYDLLVGSTASGVMKEADCGVWVLPPAEKAALV